jgi:hypothetical protein
VCGKNVFGAGRLRTIALLGNITSFLRSYFEIIFCRRANGELPATFFFLNNKLVIQ